MSLKFILITCLLCPASFAGANTVISLPVSDDAYVHGDGGDKNVSNGSRDYVRCFYNDGTSAREMIFLKFALANISTLVEGTGKTVVAARLKLHGNVLAGGGNNTPEKHVLKVFNMTATNPAFRWTEANLSYNAWAGNGSTDANNSGKSTAYFFRRNPDNTNVSGNNGKAEYLAASLTPENGEGWCEWDVTKSVKAYVGADLSLQICDDYVMRVPGSATERAYAIFHSKENASGNAPRLEIEIGDIPAGENYNISRGGEPVLLSYYNDARAYRYMPYLRFNLANVPQAQDIESVKLKMYAVADAGGGLNTAVNLTTPETHAVAVYNLNSYAQTWVEDAFAYTDWEYKYGYRQTPSSPVATLTGVTGEGWLEWDITGNFKETLLAGDRTITLSVCDTYVVKSTQENNRNAYVRFHSKENPSGNKPKLEIVTASSPVNIESEQIIRIGISGRILSVSGADAAAKLTVADISGRILHSAVFSGEYACVLPASGMYLLHVSGAKNSLSRKITVK